MNLFFALLANDYLVAYVVHGVKNSSPFIEQKKGFSGNETSYSMKHEKDLGQQHKSRIGFNSMHDSP